VVVSARSGQELPAGPYSRVDDRHPGEGPLEGIASSLRSLADGEFPWDPLPFEACVAICGCDYPFADASVMTELACQDGAWDVSIPRSGGHLHPVHAVWRVGSVVACEEALEAGRRRVRAALDRLSVNVVSADDIAHDVSRTLLNVNDPEDLRKARQLHEDR
jgi:molybdopterin-guanine dinucleotide biosynthesis protein A